MRFLVTIGFGLVSAAAAASEAEDQCARLLARTTPVDAREFVNTAWRTGNLERLRRSLHKRRGSRSEPQVEAQFQRLRDAYDAAWQRGY